MVFINKRSYFRVELVLPVKWRLLNSDEIELIQNGSGCSLLPHNLFQAETHEDLALKKEDHGARALQTLNDKLNFIINTMSGSDPLPSDDRIVEISASGLKFRTKTNPGLGAFLKMDLSFQGFPHLHVGIITEAMRIQKSGNEYLIAANILCIDENERDFLIKMIFQKQRTDIRRKKTGTETDSDATTVK